MVDNFHEGLISAFSWVQNHLRKLKPQNFCCPCEKQVNRISIQPNPWIRDSPTVKIKTEKFLKPEVWPVSQNLYLQKITSHMVCPIIKLWSVSMELLPLSVYVEWCQGQYFWQSSCQKLHLYSKHQCCVVSPSCCVVQSSAVPSPVQVWSVQLGVLLEDLPLHSDFVNCVLFSPSAPHILSAADNGLIKVSYSGYFSWGVSFAFFRHQVRSAQLRKLGSLISTCM